MLHNKRMNLTKPRAPFILAGRFQNAALQVMRGRSPNLELASRDVVA